MNRCLACFLMLVLFCCPVSADRLGYLGWNEEFREVTRWRPEPAWLSNDSAAATVTTEGQVAEFHVPEAGRGMKWSTAASRLLVSDGPLLVVRYRAEHLNTESADYLVHLDDGEPGQVSALRLCDVKDNGRWHIAAVDVRALTDADELSGLAVQVQADNKGDGRLWLDWIRFSATAPEGARWPRGAPGAGGAPDWHAPLEQSTWKPEPSWLANPAVTERCEARWHNDILAFRVDSAGCGMKWSWPLPEPVELKGHRYATLRCRARGLRPWADYLVAALGKRADGSGGYATLVPAGMVTGEDQWQTLNVDLRAAARELASIEALAVQVQAAVPAATLQLERFGLVSQRQPARLADALPWQDGAEAKGFEPIPIDPQRSADVGDWIDHLNLDRWFSSSEITIEGVPFWLRQEPPELAATSLDRKEELTFDVDAQACEVYLLALAAMFGPDEPMFGSGRLARIGDVDRFRLRLEYADGTADECLPWSRRLADFGVIEGPQVLVAAADRGKSLRQVVLCDRSKQAAFAVAAISIRPKPERLCPEALDEVAPLRLPGSEAFHVGEAAAHESGRSVRLEADLAPTGPPVLQRLAHQPGDRNILVRPCNVVELKVDGQAVPPEALRPIDTQPPLSAAKKGPDDDLGAAGGDDRRWRWFSVDGFAGLRVGVSIAQRDDGALRFTAALHNEGDAAYDVDLVAPALGPYVLGEGAESAYYLAPRCGAVLDNRDIDQSHRYCGLFPLQFLDTFDPAAGCGLMLQTEDLACLRKHYLLKKEGNRFVFGVEYRQGSLKPGAKFRTAPTVIAATDGHWRRGLEAYRRWLATWHEPRVPRKTWFREIFNFRQRFLYWHDPLLDRETGRIKLQRAVDEARREFGGIDYLPLFDWGNCGPHGRIYGRTGDYSPYDYLPGGRAALRKAIADVQALGVPVGLYIEGYLLTERGRLGQQFGAPWQLVGPDGTKRYWPGDVEMFVCPAVEPWREVQASTYARKVAELGVDGMYIDQFGFAGQQKDCWSTEHGHPVPSYAVAAERDTTRVIRDRIEAAKSGVALYTEESPVDVTTQYQDGSFTYAMLRSLQSGARVPLNLTRFAVPDFKTIEILYCDRPTGSWATGVRWVFFNGEAIWLEGPADEWFEPETRATIRRCYRILRRHRDAFTTLQPVPLVRTEIGGVYANAFPIEGKTVFTLYNSRRRTVRGGVLRVRAPGGATCYDAWHDRPATARREGEELVLTTEIGPQGAGCLVVER